MDQASSLARNQAAAQQVVGVAAVVCFGLAVLFVLCCIEASFVAFADHAGGNGLLSQALPLVPVAFASVGAFVVSKCDRFQRLRPIVFGRSGFIVLIACALVLGAVGGFIALFGVMGLAGACVIAVICALFTGVSLGILVEWWTAIWAALYVVSSKRAVFLQIMAASLLASVLFAALAFAMSDNGNAMATVSGASLLISAVGGRRLLSFSELTLEELEIPIKGTPLSSVHIPTASEGRPLSTINAGGIFAIWVCMTAHAFPPSECLILGGVMALVGSVGLFIVGIFSRNIPNIGMTDRIINLVFAALFLLMLGIGDGAVRVSLFLLGAFILVFLILAMSNVSLMVPAFWYRPFEVCGFVFGKFFLGMMAGSVVCWAFIAMDVAGVLPVCTGLCIVVVMLALIDAAFFPYSSQLLTRAYAYANDIEDMEDGTEAAEESDPEKDEHPADPYAQLDEACIAFAQENELTKRESDVLRFLLRGWDNAHIAEELFISYNTAKTHIYNIYRKVNVSSRRELHDVMDEFVEERQSQ